MYGLRQDRQLSEKGKIMFEDNCSKQRQTCDSLWNQIEDLLMTLPECNEVKALRKLDSDIDSHFSDFCKHTESFKQFLFRQGTSEANIELESLCKHFEHCRNTVIKARDDIRDRKLELVEAISQISGSSRAGSTSSQKRAKAAAERAKLEFVKKENELIKQKAEIEANINLVHQEGKVAAAEAEVSILEEKDGDLGPPLPASDKKQDMRRFIQDSQTFVSRPVLDKPMTLPAAPSPTVNFPPTSVDILNNKFVSSSVPLFSVPPPVYPTPHTVNTATIPVFMYGGPPANMNIPFSSSYAQKQQTDQTFLQTQLSATPSQQPNQSENKDVTSDITRYMLRKEFMLTRFVNFDDRPETFPSWKASFRSIINELRVTPFEEMDLLVKYLGPTSSQFAKNIRSANAHDPPRGVTMIWERLQERYGRPEMIEASIKRKLAAFPTLSNKDNFKWYDLVDILCEIESGMVNPDYSSLLSYFNSSSGVSPIVAKLPYSIQDKWASHASKYKKNYSVPFPPFKIFVSFIKEVCELRNDPSFSNVSLITQTTNKPRHSVLTRRTEVEKCEEEDTSVRCPIHKANHSLNDCRAFQRKPIQDRKKFLKDKGICFRCCVSTDHLAKDCEITLKCSKCDSNKHATALHIKKSNHQSIENNTSVKVSASADKPYISNSTPSDNVISRCSTICGDMLVGRSCGKVVLVDIFSENNSNNVVRAYALIDDQSTQTLGTPQLFDQLGLNGQVTKVIMSTCSGSVSMAGRHSSDLHVRSADGKTTIKLPRTIECDSIPCEYPEIATPEVAESHTHLKPISKFLPELDRNLKVELLIGRDLPQVHHVYEQIVSEDNTDPFAQKLSLGWVIVGEVCLGKMHSPRSINVRKTNILDTGQCTTFPLCTNRIEVKEQGDDLFIRTQSDNKVGPSVEDKQFLRIMDTEFHLDDSGHWSAPLPFKDSKEPLPNNRSQAWKRAQILDASLRKNTTKRKHFMTFMDKVISSGAAEVAPHDVEGECWYLPLFGVYHPRKPQQIRGVFDSSAVFEGVSLNSSLLTGPDLLNSLVGILLRFRKDAIAVTADIEQMFYQFHVDEKHRDYLRFYWYRNNDFTQALIEYRMKSHVFGNTPSPAIATYGIRKAVENSDADVRAFVNNDFYVDDALSSFVEKDQAIDLLKRTQKALYDNVKIRLHKIVSNDIDVMKSFDSSDLGKDLKDLNLSSDSLPLQHSLGLSWNLESDMFVFSVDMSDKPCTRRGLLSSVNSIYDPLGLLSPLTISGKMLLRELIPPGTDWDEPLSAEHTLKWRNWISSLKSVDSFQCPRMFVNTSISLAKIVELHIFCDASEQAVAAVAYLRMTNNDGQVSIGFVMGKSKLAPQKGHTIPRLELCGAVLAVEVAESVCTHLGISQNLCFYHTDSKVALGYICNTSRRFFTYVSNRVEKINKFSKPQQWSYVPSDRNPADIGTRFLNVPYISAIDSWINGPDWLMSISVVSKNDQTYLLMDPQNDKEIRPEIVSRRIAVKQSKLDSHYFEKFSTWNSLVRALSFIRNAIRTRHSKNDNTVGMNDFDMRRETERFIIRSTQHDLFQKEIDSLSGNKSVSKDSKIVQLDPFIHEDGLLRVGGRLKRTNYELGEKHPILIPGDSHIAKLLIMRYHEQCRHSGRHITEGTIRSAGLWITGLKRRLYSIISQCTICQRFRGKLLNQKMSDLPEERLRICPPFTYVGVDCFGPWEILSRRTRGGSACSKRWAIIFVCLSCRGIHIEIIEEMTTSSFVNALRRFISVRGKVKEFFSDRGSNFIGGVRELGLQAIFTEETEMKRFLNEQNAVWKFNTPYSSHHGGSWERLIGTIRRVLDSILFEARHKKLTHELLCTFMSEAMAIVNSRPLSSISSDHEAPFILSPNALITQKVGDSVEDFSSISLRDVYTSQWKFVQFLAEQFWRQWRREYLQSLQHRRKWHDIQENIREGDIVIIKDNELHRNQWPLGLIECVYPGKDNLVRKVKLRVIRDGKPHEYMRPITQIVFLCHGSSNT